MVATDPPRPAGLKYLLPGPLQRKFADPATQAALGRWGWKMASGGSPGRSDKLGVPKKGRMSDRLLCMCKHTMCVREKSGRNS